MTESTTYQAILADEAKRIVLRQGTKRFGPPDARSRSAIEAIADVDRIEQLTERMLDVSSWDELLATPRL